MISRHYVETVLGMKNPCGMKNMVRASIALQGAVHRLMVTEICLRWPLGRNGHRLILVGQKENTSRKKSRQIKNGGNSGGLNMNNDLKIRAAKALNFCHNHSRDTYHVISDNPIHMVGFLETDCWVLSGSLEFTTSYDWAFLGVNRLSDDQRSLFLEKIIPDNLIDEGWFLSKATPAQITLAWVEVLENE